MYSEIVSEHACNPRNAGPLDDATHEGVAGVPGDGPYMILWLRVEADTVVSASFKTFGCPSAIASGSVTTVLITGRPMSKAALLTPEGLLLVLGGLPEGKEYCAKLACDALQAALKGQLRT